LIVLENIQ